MEAIFRTFFGRKERKPTRISLRVKKKKINKKYIIIQSIGAFITLSLPIFYDFMQKNSPASTFEIVIWANRCKTVLELTNCNKKKFLFSNRIKTISI